METKEIVIPDGWEIKKYSGNKIVIGEKERNFPNTWKECVAYLSVREGMEYVDGNSMIHFTRKVYSTDKSNINYLPKGMGKKILSLSQLLVCRDAWWNELGWKPDWTNGFEDKFFIGNYRGIIDKGRTTTWDRVLAFPTSEVRDKFLDTFHALIEEARELL